MATFSETILESTLAYEVPGLPVERVFQQVGVSGGRVDEIKLGPINVAGFAEI